MDYSVSAIQRLFKINRINSSLKKFKQLNLDKKISVMTFDEMTLELLNSDYLTICTELMNRINRYLDPNTFSLNVNAKSNKVLPRVLLSMYIIKYFPDDIFTTIDLGTVTELSLLANNLVNFIENRFLSDKHYKNNSLNRFGFLFNTFYINYMYLVEQDRINLVKELYQEYSNASITKNYIITGTKYSPEQKTNILQVINNHIKQIEQSIKMLDKKVNISKFEEIASVEDRIKSNISKEFWNNVEQTMKNNDYTLLLNNLKNIKEILIDLTPKSIKKSEKIDLNEYLDLEFLKQKLENNVFDKEQIVSLCKYLLDKVHNLQSKVRDDDLHIFWSHCLEKLNNEVPIYEFISYFLKELYKIIDDIYCDIILLPIIMRI
jgi:hypothetical protein